MRHRCGKAKQAIWRPWGSLENRLERLSSVEAQETGRVPEGE
jgi:hypothetical protein